MLKIALFLKPHLFDEESKCKFLIQILLIVYDKYRESNV